ncbi:hypothetical protein M0R45_036082 [Rubus argutus]|uniref:Uncharacterized protein n=1 Tax=Rubus argutus TaxID=59490 RepID=A0AAW1VWI8_RUBAR
MPQLPRRPLLLLHPKSTPSSQDPPRLLQHTHRRRHLIAAVVKPLPATHCCYLQAVTTVQARNPATNSPCCPLCVQK